MTCHPSQARPPILAILRLLETQKRTTATTLTTNSKFKLGHFIPIPTSRYSKIESGVSNISFHHLPSFSVPKNLGATCHAVSLVPVPYGPHGPGPTPLGRHNDDNDAASWRCGGVLRGMQGAGLLLQRLQHRQQLGDPMIPMRSCRGWGYSARDDWNSWFASSILTDVLKCVEYCNHEKGDAKKNNIWG